MARKRDAGFTYAELERFYGVSPTSSELSFPGYYGFYMPEPRNIDELIEILSIPIMPSFERE